MFVGRPFLTWQKVKGVSESTAELSACADLDSNAVKNKALALMGLSDARGQCLKAPDRLWESCLMFFWKALGQRRSGKGGLAAAPEKTSGPQRGAWCCFCS